MVKVNIKTDFWQELSDDPSRKQRRLKTNRLMTLFLGLTWSSPVLFLAARSFESDRVYWYGEVIVLLFVYMIWWSWRKWKDGWKH